MLLTLENVILGLVVSLSATFIALYLYFIRNFKYWEKLGIPYVKPTPFVGNLKECAFQQVTIGQHLHQIYKQHSDKPYVGTFSFDKPNLLIRDVELVKKILVKDFQYFVDRVTSSDEKIDPLFSKALFLVKGQRWRNWRTKLNPVFSSGKMKMMFNLVENCGKQLADCIEKDSISGSPADVTEMMHRFTTDVIASCAFGINGHALEDPNSEFRMYARKIFQFSVQKGFAVLTAFTAPYIKDFLHLKFLDNDTARYVRNTIWSTVEYREKNGIVRNDFLDCIIQLRKKEKEDIQESKLSGKNLNEDAKFHFDGDDFVGQAFQFLAAGFETSGSTMTFALYELAQHPEIQTRLRAEIKQNLNKHNGKVTYDGIHEMVYLDMVVSETLRKYPVLPFLDRTCYMDYELPSPSGKGTITLPAGTGVFIPVLALHYEPSYFPEPEKFDPERFTEENKRSYPKYSYIPFGEGPRMCIGMRFGLMQVKTGLCHILSRMEVSPHRNTPKRIGFNAKAFLLAINEELRLTFKPV